MTKPRSHLQRHETARFIWYRQQRRTTATITNDTPLLHHLRTSRLDLETRVSYSAESQFSGFFHELSTRRRRQTSRPGRENPRVSRVCIVISRDLENCRLFTRRFSHFGHALHSAPPLFPSYRIDQRRTAAYRLCTRQRTGRSRLPRRVSAHASLAQKRSHRN